MTPPARYAGRNRTGQGRVEVVRTRCHIVGRHMAGRHIVRDAGVEAAPVAEEFCLSIARDVVGGADARRPVVLQR